MSYPIAGGIAAIFGFLELHSRLDSRPTWRDGALVWWLSFLFVEAVFGVLAATGIDLASTAGWSDGPVAGVLAGIGGSSALRLRVVTLGKGEDSTAVGPATLYEPLRDFFEQKVNDCAATAQSTWINRKVLPCFEEAGFTPQDVAHRISDYIDGSIAFPRARRQRERRFLQTTAKDVASDAEKMRTIVRHACRLSAYKVLDALVAEAESRVAKRSAPASSQPT